MNNYNCSSTGLNIEFTCERDLDVSQMYFSDNFISIYQKGGSLINSHYSNVDCYLFVDNANFDNDFDINDLDNYTFTKNNLINLMLSVENIDYIQEMTRDLFDKSFSKMTKLELIELYNNEFNARFSSSDLINYLKPIFEVIDIRGYSQGDYAEIIFRHKDIKQYNFTDKDEFLLMMSDCFTDLFYNSPIYCRLTINDDEFYIDENLKDQYKYDQDEIKEVIETFIKDYSDNEKLIIRSFIQDNLQDYI